MNTQIATAAEQQSAVAEEINSNVVRIKELGQSTADDAYRNGEISQRLIPETRRQQQLVEQFQRSRRRAGRPRAGYSTVTDLARLRG